MKKFVFVLEGDFCSCNDIIHEELVPFYVDKLGLRAVFKIGASVDNAVRAIKDEGSNDIIFVHLMNNASNLELIGKLIECLDDPPTVRVCKVESCSGGLCYKIINPLAGYEEWIRRNP